MLSQLSYRPEVRHRIVIESLHLAENVVGLGRVELPTSPLSGARSDQLSYRPHLVAGGAQSSDPSAAACDAYRSTVESRAGFDFNSESVPVKDHCRQTGRAFQNRIVVRAGVK